MSRFCRLRIQVLDSCSLTFIFVDGNRRRRRSMGRETTMVFDAQRPIWCMVTDRARTGISEDSRLEGVLDLVRNAGSAGVDLVQIRENDLSDQALLEVVRRAVEITRQTSTRIIVNDRVDVAIAAGAAGVHLKSDSFDLKRIVDLVPPGWTIGCSVHGVEEAIKVTSSGLMDYVILGTIFQTLSKPSVSAVGLDVLEDVARSVRVPVLAIGGITVDRVENIAASGAAGAAAIGLFADAGQSAKSFRVLVERLKRSFALGAALVDS